MAGLVFFMQDRLGCEIVDESISPVCFISQYKM